MRQVFNPFDKPFDKIKEKDLQVLTNVSEGWYIEYKKERPKGKKISKSISSFANSYGGIYFIGLEADKSTNCLKKIIGVDDSPDVIRDSVRHHIQPFPYFETFPITLKNGKKVIMSVIPEGENPPYLHSNGRIYRRQEAASDPIHEKERHVLDMLYQKSKEYRTELEEFRRIDYTFFETESRIPYLEIFINTKPFNHFSLINFLSTEKLSKFLSSFTAPIRIKEIINGGEISFTLTMEFDTINTYHNSAILRKIKGEDLAYNSLSVEIDIHGNAKILIPIPTVISDTKLDKRYNTLVKETESQSFENINLIDTITVFSLITVLINKYADFMAENGWTENIEIKIRLKNCWRSSLYFNSEKFFKHIEVFGLPICMKDEQYFPKYPIKSKISDIQKRPVIETSSIFSLIACALGVPTEIAIESIFDEVKKI